jgi:hypothetical protein
VTRRKSVDRSTSPFLKTEPSPPLHTASLAFHTTNMHSNTITSIDRPITQVCQVPTRLTRYISQAGLLSCKSLFENIFISFEQSYLQYASEGYRIERTA